MKQRFMEIHVQWMSPENPSKIEEVLRELVGHQRLPPFKHLRINIDHKNFAYNRNNGVEKTIPLESAPMTLRPASFGELFEMEGMTVEQTEIYKKERGIR